jgi:beta-N-acetylhexosaminidase
VGHPASHKRENRASRSIREVVTAFVRGLQHLIRLLVAVALTLHLAVAAQAADRGAATPPPTLSQLVGQKLVIRMDGTTPSAGLLARVRRGEVGGIVLFGFNITTKSALIAATAKLQKAAAEGGQPPLLIMVDQEGGTVRRLPWAGPTLSARQMGVDGSVDLVTQQGSSSAAALKAAGINVNLAPVMDVADSNASFMYRQARTFGFSDTAVARLATAFAEGTGSQGVLPVLKHFPGIGRATRNTDFSRAVIRASRWAMDEDLLPFRRAIDAGAAPIVMLSNATYSAWDSENGAGWSKAMSAFLRDDIGYTGVTITDSLTGQATIYQRPLHVIAARACRAGTDMLMLTGSEGATARTFSRLVSLAESGSISRGTLRASHDRIIALKSRF